MIFTAISERGGYAIRLVTIHAPSHEDARNKLNELSLRPKLSERLKKIINRWQSDNELILGDNVTDKYGHIYVKCGFQWVKS